MDTCQEIDSVETEYFIENKPLLESTNDDVNQLLANLLQVANNGNYENLDDIKVSKNTEFIVLLLAEEIDLIDSGLPML